jgi:hypothetical protein
MNPCIDEVSVLESVHPIQSDTICIRSFVNFLDIFNFPNITMYKFERSREGLLEKVYDCLRTGTSLDSVHIPHSDVFFVREALEDRFGRSLSLLQVEEYMKEAGWTDGNN